MSRELAVVIVGFNKGEYTARCLKSLLQTTYRPMRVLFADNASTDRTAQILEQFATVAPRHGIAFETLHFERNLGSVIPRNRAFERCTAEYVALLDNDTIIRTRRVFDILISFLRTHRQVGIATPRFLYPVQPFRIQCAGGGVSSEGRTYLYGRGADRDDPAFSFRRTVPWSLSACMVMGSKLVRELGPLDERFTPTGFEDTDYCFRCRASGREVAYVPDAEIYHAENVTTFGTPGLNIRAAMRRSQALFRKKWRHMFPDVPSIQDVANIHRTEPATPLWAMHSLPMV